MFVSPNGPPAYLLSRWVFLRLLGLTYLLAFVSLGTQVTGLVGAEGILPVSDYLDRLQDTYGADAYRRYPTLLWISSTDTTLTAVCWLGTLVSVMLIFGFAPVAGLVVLWISYLSLSIGGQAFLGFQWDTLLLETGFLACFYAPNGLRPRLTTEAAPTPGARWLVWWLLFRLMFLSGITKLASGDPTWANWTALSHHFETQPLPLWTGWFIHQLPLVFHQLATGGMFVAELVLPLAILTPGWWRRLRLVASVGLTLLQVAIGVTGNYGFFSILSVALCLTLVDDHTWRWLLPARFTVLTPVTERPPRLSGRCRSRLIALGATVMFALGGLTFAREISGTLTRAERPGLDLTWSDRVVGWVQPFRSINGYGLFRVMTVERPEIVIEASLDGAHWTEWNLKWKPGDPQKRPRLVAPHQPRLDWQLWFAALGPQTESYWLSSLMIRLLADTRVVTALMDDSPFTGTAPRYLRLAYYDYRFTTPSERGKSGAWWNREFITYLTPPISLDDVR